MTDILPCPVCMRLPKVYPSMIRDAESICCPWDDGCPDASFDFDTGYMPMADAIKSWNNAVTAMEGS